MPSGKLPLRSRITGALVRSRSATRTRPLYSRRDLEIRFLSLGLGGARPGDCSLRLGRLLPDGRLVVFTAPGQPQEGKAQQCKARSTGEQPHDQYPSPQKTGTTKVELEEAGSGKHHSLSCYLSRARAARLRASSETSRSTSRCQA